MISDLEEFEAVKRWLSDDNARDDCIRELIGNNAKTA